MVEEIEAALGPLIGEPLTDMWRYAGCQKFEFGVQRPMNNKRGEDTSMADWGLVVECGWRITGPEGPVVSSDDFSPDGRRDEGAYPFYDQVHTDSPVVEDIAVADDGAFRIRMSRGFTLEVQPAADAGPQDEQWRLMSPDKQARHFVLWGDGIEVDDE